MYRLTVYDRNRKVINTIERPTMGELLEFGKRLQQDYNAQYRLMREGEAMPLVDTRQPE